MELTVVYSSHTPCEKWLVRNCNIGKKNFVGIVDFRDDLIKNAATFTKEYSWWIERLSSIANKKLKEEGWISPILQSDSFRKLNAKEYINLSNILKQFNVKYNKKKDEFIII